MEAQVVVPARRPAPRPPGLPPRRPDLRHREHMRKVYRRRRLVALGVLTALVGGTWYGVGRAREALTPVTVGIAGLRPGGLLGGVHAAAPTFTVPADATRVELDGQDLTARAQREGRQLVVRPDPLADGRHTLRVSRSAGPLRKRSRTVSFTVDTAAPVLEVGVPGPVEAGDGVTVEGTLEKGATLRHGDAPVPTRSGRFRVEVAAPAPPWVTLVAEDRAGNETRRQVPVATVQPRTRAVHLTAQGWATASLREPILAMLDERRINAVQLDIKDEGGTVGYASQVPLANEIGAVSRLVDLRAATEEIKRRGGRVIGRVVAYRDPKLADHAWSNDERHLVVQTPAGARYGAYSGGFLNPASEKVRDYTTALALEGAEAGMDEILLDYIRRPDGNLDGMHFEGLDTTRGAEQALEDTIVQHVAVLHAQLRALGVRLGASVFGIAATRPHEIAQDVPRLARELDYVAPMLYPSHWAKGEYGIADPNRSPGPITKASLADFQRVMEGAPASLVPWLQDFSMGVRYGPDEVRAQIDAGAELGIDSFILWDSACTYTVEALDPDRTG